MAGGNGGDGGDGLPGGDGGDGSDGGGKSPQKYDAATEASLNEWVQAKRKGNWPKADEIRSQLAEKGVDAAAARPARQKPKGKADGNAAPESSGGSSTKRSKIMS